jgi:hypothetical protein
MIERFDHRPRLTALLALSTTVLVVVVVTLATLLITAPPAATPSSVSDGDAAGAAAPANMHPGVRDQAGERHHRIVGDYLSANSLLRDNPDFQEDQLRDRAANGPHRGYGLHQH